MKRKLVYKIFIRNGDHLEIAEDEEYSDYETLEEALERTEHLDKWMTYLIIPISVVVPSWADD